MLGGAPRGTPGHRSRLQSRIGPKTGVEVITEGVFTRMILDDPELTGVGAVLFDEFHERSLDADLGLALARETQGALRPDLRPLVMSATLDIAGGARVLSNDAKGGAPGSEAEGGRVENDPQGVRDLNERLGACVFPQFRRLGVSLRTAFHSRGVKLGQAQGGLTVTGGLSLF